MKKNKFKSAAKAGVMALFLLPSLMACSTARQKEVQLVKALDDSA